ncbi:MAG: diaminopimelate epimerase [Rhodospirillum sp.]|nr:diaminopimelate epimerase [Rhodospirillum sp.]MCF8499373.1 diaminopimelate epimerase [Rhodospirillum sp.]
MHGLGNDFIVIDARTHPLALTEEAVRAAANRRSGPGCDQFITIEPPTGDGHATMGIRNGDGGVVESCGNAARCVGRLLLEETGGDSVRIDTLGGPIEAFRVPGKDLSEAVTVDMGPARLNWSDLPLSGPMDTRALDLTVGPLSGPCGVSVGNPHAVFLVEDAEAIDLTTWGPRVETHPLFPKRVNVEVIHRLEAGRIRMRVWERGVGITQACGTGACATLVAAVRRGLIEGREGIVELDGGPLHISWRDSDNRILMTGSATLAYRGVLEEGGWR